MLELRYRLMADVAGRGPGGPRQGSQAEKACQSSPHPVLIKAIPLRSPPPVGSWPVSNPFKKWFWVSWGQVTAAAAQQASAYPPSSICPTEQGDSI